MSVGTVNGSDYYEALTTLSSNTTSSYDTFITVLETTVIALISSSIILSNIINLIVLASASSAMHWATRLFLMNLSTSDLLVGVIACAPAVVPAATHTWIYGDVWCQISGVAHGTSCAVSIWSISMVGLQRFEPVSFRLLCWLTKVVNVNWRFVNLFVSRDYRWRDDLLLLLLLLFRWRRSWYS